MYHSCTCMCGNISCHGCVLRGLELSQLVDDSEPVRGSRACNFLKIHDASIKIKNELSIEITKLKSDILELKCRDCKECMSVKCLHNSFYAFMNIQGSNHIRRTSSPNNGSPMLVIEKTKFKNCFYVPSFEEDNVYEADESADEVENEQEIDQFEDGDFELMFSAETTPFVGSFTENFFINGSNPLLV
ncbi:hypothetical protein TVAG_424190 [Trichomonas vaginalis G3]|uniref:Uncharacterized protein n=1 Tax=Trichomonas vaginalis (strain ATCC PRA-98 / G3) TaxID=412133 RepID=A2E1Q9_TRIV3|nr:hypothetical protein TVAGG3_0304240 [Trichomonas vaginalis G3]EAY13388.1 hypothetical protein TVAG_424190 [Trichomonas vaginalis G3]KAI5528141.1 hypothetical protein TVAGG3_0304240 [Trichomonas vaginalis G3]|eukprot:XP_001325611.1 hypothetical protein [Trichomonas vaginalis G3]